jgi:hypothetical protein
VGVPAACLALYRDCLSAWVMAVPDDGLGPGFIAYAFLWWHSL